MSVTLHTNLGELKLELRCDKTPKTAFNFLALAASGYYDATTFHRSLKGFVLQGGDPTARGKGGESIWGEPFDDEIDASLRHSGRGVLSMANKGPNTNGSQFCILYAKHAHLDDIQTVFGQVIDGWETLEAIEREPCNEKGRPLREVRLESVTIHANPLAEQMLVYKTARGPPDIQA